MKKEPGFKEVQEKWYGKLAREGFSDIENTSNPDRPLKEWHSLKAKRYQIIQANRTQYQKMIDDFINHPEFDQACRYLVKHGNSKFVVSEVKLIWELHVQGQTRRQIARRMGRCKGSIDNVIERFRAWMKLL